MSTSRTRGNPWVDQATEQVHFLDITDKSQVEPTLVRAQRAILTPGQNWRDFVHEEREKPVEGTAPEASGVRSGRFGYSRGAGGGWGSSADPKGKGKAAEKRVGRDEDFEVKFSPNVVCMEVCITNLIPEQLIRDSESESKGL